MKSRGSFVALVGPDGSGKTTLADALELRATAHGFRGVRRIHGYFKIVPSLRQVAGFLKGQLVSRDHGRHVSAVHPGMVAPVGRARAMLLFFYYLVDYWLGGFRARSWVAEGYLVLADRYYFDFLYQRGFRRLPRALVRLGLPLVARPDLVVLLAAPAADVYLRKPELTPAEITRQVELIQSARDLLGHCIEVSGVEAVENAVAAVVCELRGTRDPKR